LSFIKDETLKATLDGIACMMQALKIKAQNELGLLCSASRSLEHQWLLGQTL
jgi:hypothetical protein